MDDKQTDHDRILDALGLIEKYADVDISDHNQWLLDQIVLALAKNEDAYRDWIDEYNARLHPETWKSGVAP